MKTKKITTIKSIESKILENKKTGEWVEVRWCEMGNDGSLELWVYYISGGYMSCDDVLGFNSLSKLKKEYVIVVE